MDIDEQALSFYTDNQKSNVWGDSMTGRDREVLNMQLVLIPVLAKAWKKTYTELSDLLKKYDILGYIDVCYENYNSTGNQGIIDDLEDYVELQGGKID